MLINLYVIMGAYNFTKERRKIYQLHAEGKFLYDIAKECKISVARAKQIIKRIEENVPKEKLDKIKTEAARLLQHN